MKKRWLILLLLLVLVPVMGYAKESVLIDMTVDIDEEGWYLYTRDNLTDKEKADELKELGVDVSSLRNIMNKNDIYLDALKLSNSNDDMVEMFVVIKPIDASKNLHTYSDEEIDKQIEDIKERVKSAEVVIKKINGYKFLYSEYYDDSHNMNIVEYYTVINGNSYRFFMQKVNAFTKTEIEQINSYAKTVKFNLDEKYEKTTGKTILKDALIKGVIGAVVACIIGGIGAAVSKNKKTTPAPTSPEVNQVPNITETTQEPENKE